MAERSLFVHFVRIERIKIKNYELFWEYRKPAPLFIQIIEKYLQVGVSRSVLRHCGKIEMLAGFDE